MSSFRSNGGSMRKVAATLRQGGEAYLREIHRASQSASEGPVGHIRSRGDANLVSPRGFQKVNLLIICTLAKISSRGEFHEAMPKADLSDAR